MLRSGWGCRQNMRWPVMAKPAIKIFKCAETGIVYNVGDRVHRIGWQLTALGTITDFLEVGNIVVFLVAWDFRGMENDVTTMRSTDVIPAACLSQN